MRAGRGGAGQAESCRAYAMDLNKTPPHTHTHACPQGFELVKALHIELEPFSVDNDLMTPTFKLKRPQLQKRYQAQVDAMYAALKAADKAKPRC